MVAATRADIETRLGAINPAQAILAEAENPPTEEYYTYTLAVSGGGSSAGVLIVTRAADNTLGFRFVSDSGIEFTAAISTMGDFVFYSAIVLDTDGAAPVTFMPLPTLSAGLTVGSTLPLAAVAVSPRIAGVIQSGTLALSANVIGESNNSVTWTLEGAGSGTTITDGGLLTVAAGETVGTVITVRAVSAANGKSGTAVITVKEPGLISAVTIDPPVVWLQKRGSWMFRAAVTGRDATPVAQTVTWSIENKDDPAYTKMNGQINPAYFLAGINEKTSGTITLRATSIEDSSVSGTATIHMTGFVSVAQIRGNSLPSSVLVGTPVDLSVVAAWASDNAIPTNAEIAWTVRTAGAGITEIPENKIITPSSTGTLVLTATIADGKASTTVAGTTAVATENVSANFTITVNGFVPVSGISGLPTGGTAGIQTSLPGSANITPSDATNRTITYSVVSAGGTGVTGISGTTFTPAGTGTLRLKATIANGLTASTDYTHEWDITVAAFVAVTDITGVPAIATKNVEINLGNAVVAPEDATKTTIAWSVVTSGAGITTIPTDKKITPTGTGTLTLRATISGGTAAAGTNYTKDFTITVYEPGAAPIEIGSKEDFAKIGGEYPLSGNYIQTADIDMSGGNWTPIGIGPEATTANHFTGTFDGNGKTITNLTVSQSTAGAGLFGFISGGAVLKNITIGSSSSVTNTGTNIAYTGGICGYIRYDGSIINCVNNATISSQGPMTGGIVGGSTGKVSGSHNRASVTGAKTNVGGIVGNSLSSNGQPLSEIVSCSNTGAVSSTNTGGSSNVGGIAGGSNGKIIACYNSGNVSQLNAGAYSDSGGIAGSGREITACYNTGAVSVGNSFAGGIIGLGGGSSGTTVITACYSTGAVTGGASSCLGGILGYDYNDGETNTTVITACYWSGTGPEHGTGSLENSDWEAGPPSDTGATKFQAGWPTSGTHAQWGIGSHDGTGDGNYWKSVGSSPSTYPKLWFEN
jgi:hypothetical protein